MKRFFLISVNILFAVLISQAQFWIYDNLSEPKDAMGVATLGTKAYFAGGENGILNLSVVEIYDIEKEGWDSIITMSVSRSIPSCVATGTKVFIAGGIDLSNGAVFSEVDIWNTITKTWDVDYLSAPRLFPSAVAKDNKVLFAGGMNPNIGETYDVVEIYNTNTGTWLTPEYLSEPRSGMASAVVGDLAFFAGGFDLLTSEVSDVVDIYRFSTGTWTHDHLSQARGFAAATSVGSKVVIAGGAFNGDIQSDVVDIYDTVTGWTTATLSVARSFHQWDAATASGNAYFVGGGKLNISTGEWKSVSDVIDIYNYSSEVWSTDNLTHAVINHAVAGVNDHLIVAGGYTVAPNPYLSTVEIFIDTTGINPGVDYLKLQEDFLRVYPNPTSGIIHLDPEEGFQQNAVSLLLYNMQGQRVYEQTLPAGTQEINIQLPNGVYVLKVQAGDRVQQELVTIQR